jgi:hypothetical protein
MLPSSIRFTVDSLLLNILCYFHLKLEFENASNRKTGHFVAHVNGPLNIKGLAGIN